MSFSILSEDGVQILSETGTLILAETPPTVNPPSNFTGNLPSSIPGTVTPFTPVQSTPPFSFQAVLDGATYLVTATWNLTNRWYVNVFDGSNARVLTVPLLTSPPAYDISLTAGYFTSKMIFRQQNFIVTP